jgi:SRSO17 transposase
VSADRAFATKPELARQMLVRALDAGVPAAWVAADEVYGQSPGLRRELETRGVGYVLAIASSHRVAFGPRTCRADQVAAEVPKSAWQRLSAGAGAKGRRWYDWAFIEIDRHESGHRQLLIRRNRRTGELAFYRCYSPRTVPPHLLVKVAGRRWTIEESLCATRRSVVFPA